MSKTHLVGVSSDPKLIERLRQIAADFEFNAALFSSCDEMNEKFDGGGQRVLVSVLSVVDVIQPAEVAGQLQVMKYSCQDSYTILIIDKKLPPDSIAFIKKSGADIIIFESEAFETSFLEFILSQRIRGSMISMKLNDFKADSEISFGVFTILPLAQKQIPVLYPGEIVTSARLAKLQSVKEFYVVRDEIDKVQEYLKKYQDLSAQGIVSRCRANYIGLCKAHTDFMTVLFDKSDRATFVFGKELLDKCTKIATEMLMNLSTLGDPWSIINNSTIGETGSVERSPSVSAMAGLMTLSLDGIDTERTIVAGLLSDIGMLSLHPNILRKIRQGKSSELTSEEVSKYQQHPLYSINRCLEKKIPLSEEIKKTIMTTHEKFDKSGYPNKINPDYISKESQLLQYCEFVDQRLAVKMGSKAVSCRDIQVEVLSEELANKKILNLETAMELKKFLELSGKFEKAG